MIQGMVVSLLNRLQVLLGITRPTKPENESTGSMIERITEVVDVACSGRRCPYAPGDATVLRVPVQPEIGQRQRR
jgi:hypothetical protein